MAEPFNPEAFRQQMTQNQTCGIPSHPSPQVPVAPQMPSAVTMPLPVQAYPAELAPPPPPNPHRAMPQYPQNQAQSAPYGAPAQQGYPQAGQYQQPPQAAQYQPAMQPQGLHSLQPAPVQGQSMEAPKAKKGLFKRTKLKGLPEHLPNAGAFEKKMKSPLLGFAGGLVLGVLGTIGAIMMFSGEEPQRATVTASEFGPAGAEQTPHAALTDKMLLDSQAGQGKQP